MEIDSCAKLLDNGWSITLFKNEIGTYSAVATKGDEDDIDELSEGRITDDFTPSKAVCRLTEKMFGNIWDGVDPTADIEGKES